MWLAELFSGADGSSGEKNAETRDVSWEKQCPLLQKKNAVKQWLEGSALWRNIRCLGTWSHWGHRVVEKMLTLGVPFTLAVPREDRYLWFSVPVPIFKSIFKLRISCKDGHILAQVSSQPICYHLFGSVILKNLTSEKGKLCSLIWDFISFLIEDHL